MYEQKKVPFITVRETLAFVAIGLLILILPAILTKQAILEGLDFTETGQIGDTIGGVTAPFIGFFAAILVYLSFRQQLRANEIILQENKALFKIAKDERKYEYFLRLIDSLDNRINSFKLYRIYPRYDENGHTSTRVIYSGIDGLQRYVNDLYEKDGAINSKSGMERELITLKEQEPKSAFGDPNLSEIYHFTYLLLFISKNIQDTDIDWDIKIELFSRLDVTFKTSLQSPIETFIKAYNRESKKNETLEHLFFDKIQENFTFYEGIRNKFIDIEFR